MLGCDLTCVCAYGNFTASKVYHVHEVNGLPFLIDDKQERVIASRALFEATHTIERRNRSSCQNKVTQTGTNFTQAQMDAMTRDILEPTEKAKVHINPVAKPMPKVGQVWVYKSRITGKADFDEPYDLYYITRIEHGRVYNRSCAPAASHEYSDSLSKFTAHHILVF